MKYESQSEKYGKLVKSFMISLHEYLIGVLKLTESHNANLYVETCRKSDFSSKAVSVLKEWVYDNESNMKVVDSLLKKGDYSISLAAEIENTPRPKNFNIGTLYQDYLDEQKECEKLIGFLNEDIESARDSDNFQQIANVSNANIERLQRLSVELGRLAKDLKRG